MNTDLPGDISGNHPLASWLNRLKRAVAARTVLQGVNYRVRRTPSGVQLDLAGGNGGSGRDGDPGAPTLFLLREVGMETLRCVLASAPEGPDVYVAKPTKLRASISSETFGTLRVDYSGQTGSLRVAEIVADNYTETQIISPPWLVRNTPTYPGDNIWALPMPSETLGGVAITWLDINDDGRAWATI